jgi:FKBP-type peptidyl-prolyl cis-trans isomerase
MKNLIILVCLAITFASCSSGSKSGNVPLKSLNDSFAYAFGASVGNFLKTKKVKEVNWDVFKASLEYCMVNGDSGLIIEKEKLNEVFDRYIDEVAYSEVRQKNKDFLEAKKKEGYKSTESGLLYKVIKNGNGVKPSIVDSVFVFYTGSFMDGKVFDSNIGREAMKSGLNSGLIKGFLEGLLLMDEGANYEFVIPYDLAYGKEGKANPYTGEMMMEPYQTLIFNVTLDHIQK